MNNKIMAVAAVAILAIAAVGVVLLIDDEEEDGSITIVDGANKTIKLDSPLTKVAVLNKNVPNAMKMLGIDDTIECYHYSGSIGINAETLQKTESDRKLGTYYTPSIETLLKYEVEALICPVSSMTIYSNGEKSCEQNGIKVIRLDCNGDTILEDLKKLSKVFGDPQSAVSIINEYEGERKGMISAIGEAIDGKDLYDFLAVFGSRNSMYNTASEMSGLMETIFDKNVTSYTDLPTTSVTNMINSSSQEAISEVMDKVDVVLMRTDHAVEGSVAPISYDEFIGNGTNKLVTTSSPAYQNNRIYSIESGIMSGLYGHIGLLILVNCIYDVQVDGYSDINKVITDFQEKYDQSIIVTPSAGETIESEDVTSDLVYQFGKDLPANGVCVFEYQEN